MSVLLAIETSADRHAVVLGRGPSDFFDSTERYPLDTSRDLQLQVLRGLSAIGASVGDLRGIAVNVGPGALTSIRAAVAFANALAFSRSIPIYPLNHFEILGAQARETTELPVLCATPATGDAAYVGLFVRNALESMRYGPLEATASKVAAGHHELAVAGRLRSRLATLLPQARIVDTGIDKPAARIAFALGWSALERGAPGAAQVSPLNEESPEFG